MNEETKEHKLEIEDLLVLRNMMKVACDRGAFKAEEFVDVGTAFAKLNNYCVAIAVKQKEAEDVKTS